jgi:hypothetical protein
MQITVIMTNFGNVVYQGNLMADACERAVSTGFECTVTMVTGNGDILVRSWSPIGGWR